MNRLGNQAIPTNTWTAISWTSAPTNEQGIWNAAQPTRLTIPQAGIYSYNAWVRFAANATGNRGVRLTGNGSSDAIGFQIPASGGGEVTWITLGTNSAIVVVGDYSEFYVYQGSGGNLNVTAIGNVSRTGDP